MNPLPTLPSTCERCAHVEHIVGPTQVHRWRCLRGQQMQAPCPSHSPIADGRKASTIEEAQS